MFYCLAIRATGR